MLVKDVKIFLKKKNEKGEYGLTWYEKLSEDEKERLVEYRKRYYKMQKKINLL